MINTAPELKFLDQNSLIVVLNPEFEKYFDCICDHVGTIFDYYHEDPYHCKIFMIHDVYRFTDDLNKCVEDFKGEIMNSITKERIKMNIQCLCEQFIQGAYLVPSDTFYNIWDNQQNINIPQFNLNCY